MDFASTVAKLGGTPVGQATSATPSQVSMPTQPASQSFAPTASNFADTASHLGGTSELNTPSDSKNLFQKVGDFFTGSTQAFGKDIGESLASGKNTQDYIDTLKLHTDVNNNLIKAIKAKRDAGQDTSKLEMALIDHQSSMPKIEDFQGSSFNKTGEQVIGDALGTGLEALSGGLLEGGTKAVASKELSTLGKVREGAKLGAAYGGVGGGVNAMQNNESASDVGIGALEGAGLGAATAGTLGLVGAAGNGLVSKIGEYSTSEGLTKKLGDIYGTILNLTPKQQTLEGKFDQDAGAHMANLAHEGVTLPIGHNSGNLVTDEAQSILKDKFIQPENTLLDKLVASEQKSVPWTQLKSDFLKTANQLTGSDSTNATNKISKELSAYEKQYKNKFITMADGSKNIKLEDVNQMRRDFWAKAKPAFNSTNDEKLQANVFNKLGHVARNTVLENTDSNLAGNLLKRLGDHQHLLQILQQRNNKPIGMSVLKQYIAKFGLGAIGDMVAGHGGGMIGYWSGGRLAHLLDNPNIDTAMIRSLLEKQPIKNPEILKNVNELLDVREKMMSSRLQLEAPAEMGTSKNPYIMGSETNAPTYEAPAQKINKEEPAPLLSLPQKGQTSARIPLLGAGEAQKNYEKSMGLNEVKNTKVGYKNVEPAPIATQNTIKTSSIPKELQPLAEEAKKYKSAEEFVKAMKSAPEKIPSSPEYKQFLLEKDAFVKRENEIYTEMKSMRDKYTGKTINDVPPSDITKYDELQKELNQTLSKKTLAKSPEGITKTHIGDKGLESQLTDIWNKANKR